VKALYRTHRRNCLFRCSRHLGGANLERANLTKADLQGTDLDRANLYLADLEGAEASSITVLPEGFDPKAPGTTNEFV
jgi:uncharacterized protein YjbI with pentapeptide repeats